MQVQTEIFAFLKRKKMLRYVTLSFNDSQLAKLKKEYASRDTAMKFIGYKQVV